MKRPFNLFLIYGLANRCFAYMYPAPFIWDFENKELRTLKSGDMKLIPWYIIVVCHVAGICLPATIYGIARMVTMSTKRCTSLGEDCDVASQIIGISIRGATAVLIVVLLWSLVLNSKGRFELTAGIRCGIRIFEKLEAEHPKVMQKTQATLRRKMDFLWWSLQGIVCCLATAPFSFTLISVIQHQDPCYWFVYDFLLRTDPYYRDVSEILLGILLRCILAFLYYAEFFRSVTYITICAMGYLCSINSQFEEFYRNMKNCKQIIQEYKSHLTLHYRFFYKLLSGDYLILVISMHPFCVYAIWLTLEGYTYFGWVQWLSLLVGTIYVLAFSLVMLSVAASLDTNTKALISRLEKEFGMYPWKKISGNFYTEYKMRRRETKALQPISTACGTLFNIKSGTRFSYMNILIDNVISALLTFSL